MKAGNQKRIFDGRYASADQRNVTDSRVDSSEGTHGKDKIDFVIPHIDLAASRHAQIITIDNQVLGRKRPLIHFEVARNTAKTNAIFPEIRHLQSKPSGEIQEVQN